MPTGISNHAVVALAAAMPNNVNPRAQSGANMRGCVTCISELMVFLLSVIRFISKIYIAAVNHQVQ